MTDSLHQLRAEVAERRRHAGDRGYDGWFFAFACQRLAGALVDAGRAEEALQPALESLATCRRLRRRRFGRHVGRSLFVYARVLRALGRTRETLEAMEEAVAILRAPERHPRDDSSRLGLCLWHLTGDLIAAGRAGDAVLCAREALSLWQRLSEQDAYRVPDVGFSYDNLSLALAATGEWEQAVQASRSAIAVFDQEEHGTDMALSLVHLADALEPLGDRDGAAAARAQAAALERRVAAQADAGS